MLPHPLPCIGQVYQWLLLNIVSDNSVSQRATAAALLHRGIASTEDDTHPAKDNKSLLVPSGIDQTRQIPGQSIEKTRQ